MPNLSKASNLCGLVPILGKSAQQGHRRVNDEHCRDRDVQMGDVAHRTGRRSLRSRRVVRCRCDGATRPDTRRRSDRCDRRRLAWKSDRPTRVPRHHRQQPHGLPGEDQESERGRRQDGQHTAVPASVTCDNGARPSMQVQLCRPELHQLRHVRRRLLPAKLTARRIDVPPATPADVRVDILIT